MSIPPAIRKMEGGPKRRATGPRIHSQQVGQERVGLDARGRMDVF